MDFGMADFWNVDNADLLMLYSSHEGVDRRFLFDDLACFGSGSARSHPLNRRTAGFYCLKEV